jgi:hypothetical protein
MTLYECVLYKQYTGYTKLVPVQIDGHLITREVVAMTARKARYSYWLDLTEYDTGVRLQDIRVRSLARKQAPAMADNWRTRLETANAIIRVMAAYGRHFFSENSDNPNPVSNPFVAHFQVDRSGELWFVDRYTRQPILVRHFDWPGFTDGETLRCLVEHLAAHIRDSKPINLSYFSPSPPWICRGDLWGYGEDMIKVRDAVAALIGAQ